MLQWRVSTQKVHRTRESFNLLIYWSLTKYNIVILLEVYTSSLEKKTVLYLKSHLLSCLIMLSVCQRNGFFNFAKWNIIALYVLFSQHVYFYFSNQVDMLLAVICSNAFKSEHTFRSLLNGDVFCSSKSHDNIYHVIL